MSRINQQIRFVVLPDSRQSRVAHIAGELEAKSIFTLYSITYSLYAGLDQRSPRRSLCRSRADVCRRRATADPAYLGAGQLGSDYINLCPEGVTRCPISGSDRGAFGGAAKPETCTSTLLNLPSAEPPDEQGLHCCRGRWWRMRHTSRFRLRPQFFRYAPRTPKLVERPRREKLRGLCSPCIKDWQRVSTRASRCLRGSDRLQTILSAILSRRPHPRR